MNDKDYENDERSVQDEKQEKAANEKFTGTGTRGDRHRKRGHTG